MRLSSFIAFVAILSALLGGCSSTPPGNQTTASSPSPSPGAPGATVPPALASDQPALPSPITTSDLIQPVNSVERTKQIAKGRTDPFGLPVDLNPVPVKAAPGQGLNAPNGLQLPNQIPEKVPFLPELPLPPELPNVANLPKIPNQPVIKLPTLPALPLPPEPQKIAQAPSNTQTPKAGNKSPNVASRPRLPKLPEIKLPFLPELPLPPTPDVAAAPTAPKLPTIPQPDLAQATEVTGVVQVGSVTQVIIKAPNETTPRYVTVGQRLANGQVILKRVEMKQGSDPIVILEQNGIEVAKMIGEKPATPGTSDTPAKSTPSEPSKQNGSLTSA